jgi:hypothetical protein
MGGPNSNMEARRQVEIVRTRRHSACSRRCKFTADPFPTEGVLLRCPLGTPTRVNGEAEGGWRCATGCRAGTGASAGAVVEYKRWGCERGNGSGLFA